MKKSTLNRLRANLDKALEPPRATPPKEDNSDSLAQRYAVRDDPPRISSLQPPPRTDSVPRVDSVPGTENRITPVQNVPGTESVPRVESVPRKGHLQLSNEFLYDIMPRLKPSDGYVLLYLIARTHGFRQARGTVTLDAIAKACSVSRSQARVNVNSLIKKGYLRHLGTDTTNRNPLLRGLVLEVLQPSIPRTESIPRTDSVPGTESTPIKETHRIKEHTQKNASVRVGSRFTLAECRRYAESLRAEGINNPGGYATLLHRSGEADEPIAAFLTPAEVVPTVDVSKCPDCRGTGFWEPGGAGKGVAKCKHERAPL